MEGNGKLELAKNSGDAFMDQMKIMNSIIREMKEIPELPSEVPTDQAALEKVEFPDEGGMLTYMSGHDGFPYRGFPFFEIVEKIDMMKKLSRATLSGLYHSLKRKKYWLFTLIPAIWVIDDLIQTGVYTFYRLMERTRVKSQRYSRAVRELHRAFTIPRNEDLRTQELRLMMRDLICMILEFDNAYRFRAQDWIEYLDQSALRKNPTKELLRLLTVVQTHETTSEVRDTWTLLKVIVTTYLRFNKKFRNLIVDVLCAINKNELRLSIEDKHFCVRRKDYSFNFMQNPQREDKWIIELDKTNHEMQDKIKELELGFTKEHVDLDTRFTSELEQISKPVKVEELQARMQIMEKARQTLREESILKEKAILDMFKTPEQIKLAETQAEYRSLIITRQTKDKEELENKYKLIKESLKK